MMSAKCEICYGQHLTADHNKATGSNTKVRYWFATITTVAQIGPDDFEKRREILKVYTTTTVEEILRWADRVSKADQYPVGHWYGMVELNSGEGA